MDEFNKESGANSIARRVGSKILSDKNIRKLTIKKKVPGFDKMPHIKKRIEINALKLKQNQYGYGKKLQTGIGYGAMGTGAAVVGGTTVAVAKGLKKEGNMLRDLGFEKVAVPLGIMLRGAGRAMGSAAGKMNTFINKGLTKATNPIMKRRLANASTGFANKSYASRKGVVGALRSSQKDMVGTIKGVGAVGAVGGLGYGLGKNAGIRNFLATVQEEGAARTNATASHVRNNALGTAGVRSMGTSLGRPHLVPVTSKRRKANIKYYNDVAKKNNSMSKSAVVGGKALTTAGKAIVNAVKKVVDNKTVRAVATDRTTQIMAGVAVGATAGHYQGSSYTKGQMKKKASSVGGIGGTTGFNVPGLIATGKDALAELGRPVHTDNHADVPSPATEDAGYLSYFAKDKANTDKKIGHVGTSPCLGAMGFLHKESA
jgi:hypothetical protein